MSDILAPSVVRPAPHRIGRGHVWVVSDEEPTAGFAVFVPANMTVAERRAFNAEYDRILSYVDEYRGTALAEQSAKEEPDDLVFALIAPYVKEWNAEAPDESGEYRPLPPPSADPNVLARLERPYVVWVIQRIGGGYRSGKGAPTSSGPSAPTSGPQTEPPDPS